MNQLYQVIILDDEPPARKLLEVFVDQMPDLNCVVSCSNAMQGLEAIQNVKPDLLLLDIRMPEMTGIELMSLPLLSRPEIILTTAYPEYALIGYEFSVLDYLVKPIAFERFVKSIVKFRQKRQSISLTLDNRQVSEALYTQATPPAHQSSPLTTDSVWLREEKRLLQVSFRDILYIEGVRDYVKVYTIDQEIFTHMGIGQAEKLFVPPDFVRVHRSFIVRRSAIRLIDGNTMKLTNGKQLVIGPLYREALKKYIEILSDFQKTFSRLKRDFSRKNLIHMKLKVNFNFR